MQSRWYELKPRAITLRKRGNSIGKIEGQLGIPRSTLSGWFRDITLSQEQHEKILREWKKALVKNREGALRWHHEQKRKRLQDAETQALATLHKINTTKKEILELSFALLYLGEGAKKTSETAIGSSDPLILKFSLAILRNIYHIELKKIRCELYIRADQNPNVIKQFWAQELKLPLENFKQINIDKRTAGSKTYPDYKGVCHIRCGSVATQRKLLYLSKLFCQKIVNRYLGG